VCAADNCMYHAKLHGAGLEVALAASVKAGPQLGRGRHRARPPKTDPHSSRHHPERRLFGGTGVLARAPR
jgi:hypothetical protein